MLNFGITKRRPEKRAVRFPDQGPILTFGGDLAKYVATFHVPTLEVDGKVVGHELEPNTRCTSGRAFPTARICLHDCSASHERRVLKVVGGRRDAGVLFHFRVR